MNKSTFRTLSIAVGFLTALAPATLHAEQYVVHEVMSGLVTPRGLALGPEGALYVAEAGNGGNGPSVVLGNNNPAYFGTSSGLSRLQNGVQTRVLSGLPSVATAAGLDAGGLQDIAFDAAGQAFGLFGFGSDATQRDTNLGTAGALLGTVARISLDGSGTVERIADVAAYERDSNPAGGNIDSNPFGLALTPSGELLIADAGGNDFVGATTTGVVSTLGVLPARPNPLPFGPPVFQSVPTSIAVGPDGAYYVGQLTGFPFPPGAANVYRYDPTTQATTVAYSGFTNIVDIAFDASGDLFVLQISTNGLSAATGPGPGLLMKIDTETGDRTTIASEGLFFPGSVLAGSDGTIYVTNRTNVPTGGQVLAITQVPEPSTWTLIGIAIGCLAFTRRMRRRTPFVRSAPGKYDR